MDQEWWGVVKIKKLLILGLIFSIVSLLVVSYVFAHGDEVFDFDDVEDHRQHHIEMHGSAEDFGEMHNDFCSRMHNSFEGMEGHHKLMHGGN